MVQQAEEPNDVLAEEGRPVPARGTRRKARIAAMVGYAVLLGIWIDLLGIPNDTLQVFLWLWLGTIAWNIEAEPRYHLYFLRDWWLPVVGLVIYFYSRGLTDELGLPVHITMPIRFDEWLGGGITPTERLQDAWCGDPCLKTTEARWYDLFFTTVYATHFLTGLTIAAVLWVRNRRDWMMWMRRYVGINFGALVIYIVYPMAPPWMASEQGYMGDVTRITSRGWSDIGLERIDLILHGVGNPVAAMPSLHAGISFLVAMYAVQRLRTPWRFALLLYPLAMSTALVYFAEHYVIDVLAGGLLAFLVLVAANAWERRRAV
ncbi:phosphatase PAP2 family protein [Nocardioides lianchengensis]|uniref:PAP2 superfamily protein n=1 Tax=Nocardioides lianchengensis TaxID=1045774 RepID=A0A1G6IGB8_9ACTN|nr:phosphatase PAP2 family protein [Nocardioides lianchengensis]NYG13051.1 membrane-associated phospholipid phosphatase [Nocardioides lianchengensis]SDC05569.1 PAP2 superfamily protein [Nocardioides lianchengensis]